MNPYPSLRLTPTAIVIALMLACCTVSNAGVFSTYNWTSDADSQVTSANIYTHAIDFHNGGNPNPVNGVQFTTSGSNVTSGANYALTGTTASFVANPSNLPAGTFSEQILNNFFYGQTAGEASLTLTGLNPYYTYTTTLYNEGFGSPGNRQVNITASDDANTTLIDQNQNGDNNGLLVKYTYVAPASGSMVFTFSAVNPGSTWHHYGFSNAIVRTAIPGLFNTGAETTLGNDADTGNIVAEIDDHWSIVFGLDGQTSGPEAFVLQGNPGWLANSASSRWLSGRAAANGVAIGGPYHYQTSFDLTGFDPDTVLINLLVAADDAVLDVLVNGQSTGLTMGGFGALVTLTLDARIFDFFTTGVNTLTFIVNNGSTGPTGFRAEINGAAAQFVPTPAALPAGLAALSLIALRRRR